jgi:hypothetical protein
VAAHNQGLLLLLTFREPEAEGRKATPESSLIAPLTARGAALTVLGIATVGLLASVGVD